MRYRSVQDVADQGTASDSFVNTSSLGATGKEDSTARVERIVGPSLVRRVVINADDFGMSLSTNRAILAAFERGLISSTTLIVNRPGFHDACELVHNYRLTGKVGLHFNLTSGAPLTSECANCTAFCDENGQFRKRRRILYLDTQEKIALRTEIAAQYHACVAQGILPTHLDSHHHVHTEIGVMPVIIEMAMHLGIKGVRLAWNCGHPPVGRRWLRYVVAQAIRDRQNTLLRKNGLARTRFFGSARDVSRIIRSAIEDIEVMVHPKLGESETLVDLKSEDLVLSIQRLGVPHSEMCGFGEL